MTARIRRKLVILTVSCSVLLQFGGCIQVAFEALLDASLTALLNNVVTQFLPLNVNVVEGSILDDVTP